MWTRVRLQKIYWGTLNLLLREYIEYTLETPQVLHSPCYLLGFPTDCPSVQYTVYSIQYTLYSTQCIVTSGQVCYCPQETSSCRVLFSFSLLQRTADKFGELKFGEFEFVELEFGELEFDEFVELCVFLYLFYSADHLVV